jgi:hypothetical protein
LQIVALAEDSVEQSGRRQKAVSAFLTRICQSIENTRKRLVAGPHGQHHVVSTVPVQDLHKRWASARWLRLSFSERKPHSGRIYGKHATSHHRAFFGKVIGAPV